MPVETNQTAAKSMVPLRVALAYGGWSVSSAVILRVGSVALSLLLARALLPAQFGLYGLGLTTALVVSTLVTSPLAAALTRRVAETSTARGALGPGPWVALLLSGGAAAGLSALSLWLLAEPLSGLLRESDAEAVLRWSAFYVLANGIHIVLAGLLSGLFDFRTQTLMAGADVVLGVPFALVLGAMAGAAGAVAGAALGLSGGVLVGLVATIRHLRRSRFRSQMSRRSEGKSLVLPLFLAGVVVAPVNWVGTSVLLKVAGPVELGVFVAASTLSSFLVFLPGVLSGLILPYLSRLSDDQNEHAINQIGSIAQLITLPLGIALVGAAPLVAGALLPAELSAHPLVPELQSAAVACSALASVVGQIFVSNGRVWWMVLANGTAATVFLLLVWVLVPDYGAEGLAAANLVEYALHLTLVYVLRVTVLRLPVQSREGAGLLIGAALLMAAGVLATTCPPLLAAVVSLVLGLLMAFLLMHFVRRPMVVSRVEA